jgi:hypothetical protein
MSEKEGEKIDGDRGKWHKEKLDPLLWTPDET